MVVLREVEAPMAWPRSDQLLVMKAKIKKKKKKNTAGHPVSLICSATLSEDSTLPLPAVLS